jgi:hypothetical protein
VRRQLANGKYCGILAAQCRYLFLRQQCQHDGHILIVHRTDYRVLMWNALWLSHYRRSSGLIMPRINHQRLAAGCDGSTARASRLGHLA